MICKDLPYYFKAFLVGLSSQMNGIPILLFMLFHLIDYLTIYACY